MSNTKLMELPGPGAYAFGPFVVDPLRRRLWRDRRPVPITSKTLDVLVVLLEHRGHVVSKDELLNRVWPSTAVNENNLARQVSSLRRALGQRPDQHDYVVTITGQGYRFVATVQDMPDVPLELRMAADAHPDLVSESAPEPEDGDLSTSSRSSRAESRGDQAVADRSIPGIGAQGAPDAPTRLGLPRIVVAVTCGVLVTAAVVILWLRPAPAPAEPRRALHRITYDEAALPREAAWAPDGQWVVYAADRAGNADLWKQRLDDPDPIRLTSSQANDSQPQWSPDGQTIVFRSERDGGGLYVVPASGGVERGISSFGYEPRWSPDGTLILFKRSAVLPDEPTMYVVGLDGKPPRPVRPDILGQFSSLHTAWHPDGRRISIWGAAAKAEPRFLNVPLEAGTATTPAISAPVSRELMRVAPGRFVWAPSRRYVYFEGRADDTQNIWRVTIDPSTENWVAGPERLTTGAGQETNLAISPDGTRLLFTTTTSRTRVWAFPFDSARGRITGRPSPITQGNTGEVDFDARADGSKVAYRTVRAGRNELWERSIGEGHERLLLSSSDWQFTKPRWSPDGARLAFSRYATRDHLLAVALLNTDGSGERVLTKPAHVDMQGSDWSRDGQAILGSCRFSPSERYSTCLVPVSAQDEEGEPAVRVIASDPKRNLYNQRFSPDQRWVTFLAHDLLYAATSTIYVIPAGGGVWRAITDGTSFDDKPRWGPDGRVLYFVSNRSGLANVWGRRFNPSSGTPAGEPFPVTSFGSAQFQLTPRRVQMDIAVTATTLLLPLSESRSEIWMLDQIDR